MIEAPHTPEECLQTLDDISAQGPEMLRQWSFACAAGDHTRHVGYANVEAPSEEAARAMAGSGQSQAHVSEVGQLTQEQVRAFHHPG